MADVLTENERAVLKAFFNHLAEDELLSLAQTVTQNKIVISGRQDAVEAILNFSPSTESILKRKKVKTEYLVQFLHNCNIPITEKIEKPTLIRRFLENLPSHPQAPASLHPSDPKIPSTESTASEANQTGDSNSSFGAAFLEQFVPWYLEVFNCGPPHLGPQHFWADAELQLKVQHARLPARCLTASGAEAISSELAALHRDGLRLVAAPQAASESAGAKIDAFGRVTLHLRGVVHHASVGGPAGLFQQALGLMEDVPSTPSEGRERRYKIKFLHLEVDASIDPSIICAQYASICT